MSKTHWDRVYRTKSDREVSWTQQEPTLSLRLIAEVAPTGSVIDVGGGAFSLAQRLLEAGHTAIAVLDISDAALDHAKSRLGERFTQVQWVVADLTKIQKVGQFDVWHDRAVFHFLTGQRERDRYISLLRRTVPVGGCAIIATFALDGPISCSGLDVMRYDGHSLHRELGHEFALLKTVPETHLTPWGKPQSFQYGVFRRDA